MNQGKYIFSQLCQFLPRRVFDCIVNKYDGNKYIKSFSCWNQLLVLIMGQISNRESLRDLVVSLNAHKDKFHHLGFGKSVTRSNLAKANEIREVRIFEEYANRLIMMAKNKRQVNPEFPFENEVFAFDSSTITFCLSLFWWSKQHKGKGGVKLHTLYDIKSEIPLFNIITDHTFSDCNIMPLIPYIPSAFYVFDKAYVNTPELNRINQLNAFFVVRRKQNMQYKVSVDRNYNNAETGIMSDQIIKFTSRVAKRGYPGELRHVLYYSSEHNTTFSFLTNNYEISAETIALLYKYRWKIEIFFKWIKQHLIIKEFYGTSENAIKIQIYSTIITYCLILIVKEELKIDLSAYEMLKILNFSLFEKTPLKTLFKDDPLEENYQNDRQLKLIFF